MWNRISTFTDDALVYAHRVECWIFVIDWKIQILLQTFFAPNKVLIRLKAIARLYTLALQVIIINIGTTYAYDTSYIWVFVVLNQRPPSGALDVGNSTMWKFGPCRVVNVVASATASNNCQS